ncbi:hypothetical protein JOC74_000032 [Bacillus capparidis]|uniref:Uncharacterized protein n=1 Tax=Bacillus capparidis TaxID=1840411 RepID=A0ABS4CQW6_9BACI|nr:hypothetical protein [Bacillus capparidis]
MARKRKSTLLIKGLIFLYGKDRTTSSSFSKK